MQHKNLKLFAITLFCIGLNGLQAQTVKDIDGNVYKTITIGTQVWMAENLKTTKYRNGDLIGTTSPATLDISGESTPKYQWAFGGNESNVAIYGRLYTWYVVSDSRNVCPTGWHVPTDAEWTTLTTYLGGESVAGGKLKETGTTHWKASNRIATNETGFTALPSGKRLYKSTYGNTIIYTSTTYTGYWWSSTVYSYSTTDALDRSISSTFNSVNRETSPKHAGFSVRCLRD